jgi:2-iminobutanoate/2-iminopropanoate deaminase
MSRTAYMVKGAVSAGLYSHAVESDGLVALSGQTPTDMATGKIVDGPIAAQTDRCLDNLFTVLKTAGLTQDDVINVQVYLTDMADFAAMNAAYIKRFNAPHPARTTIGVAALPQGARVEIGLWARRPR